MFVFDECHRSHFGELHQKITKNFKNYHLFGFTGTPIFPQNAGSSKNPLLKTTEQAFGDKLHHYTIVNAIHDANVLPFRIDYINTIQVKKNMADKKVSAIDTEEALASPKRISEIVSYVLKHFDHKTMRNTYYQMKDRRVCGFNSIFAAASIPVVKKYYEEFKKQIQNTHSQLKIATIFSYAQNEEEVGGILTEEEFETGSLNQPDREFLESAIADYNKMFATNFDTSGDKFLNYYKDVAQRMKNRELDLLIVVNMFLTGFDATTLNTLWVDKNLKQHGLLAEMFNIKIDFFIDSWFKFKIFGYEVDVVYAWIPIFFMCLWGGWGGNFIILSAGLENVPKSLYEAADIDGCSKWKKIRNVTLPGIKGQLVLTLFTTIIGYMGLYGQNYVLFGGGPANARLSSIPGGGYTSTLIYFIQDIVANNADFKARMYGLGAAASIIFALFVGIITGIQMFFKFPAMDIVYYIIY